MSEKIALRSKLAYGFGSVAYGIKNSGFDYFLLLFYSQVIGLEARLVGLAITVALVFDALSDPIVGYWSDHCRSRWGRRHPFMYFSAFPAAFSYYFLWVPPQGLSQGELFVYLLLLAVSIRTLITFYETPSSAMCPELSRDYDERSELMSLRYYFGWSGGTAMTGVVFFVLFPLFGTADFPDGRFNPLSYHWLGLIGAALILLSILVSSLGTHSCIPRMRQVQQSAPGTAAGMVSDIWRTLANRSFMVLFAASILSAVGTGLAGALTFYFYTYFFAFSSLQTGVILIGVLGSALIGLVLAPRMSRRLGKKRGAIVVGLLAAVFLPLPVALRLFDVLPDNGSVAVFWIVFVNAIFSTGLVITVQILMSSMIADLAEHTELRTGKRSEGVLFAAVTFIRKSVQGFGLLAASWILYLAGFESGAQAGEVSSETLWKLGAYYTPAVELIWIAMVLVLSAHAIDRNAHGENLRALAEREQS